jgi:hypothetical protein
MAARRSESSRSLRSCRPPRRPPLCLSLKDLRVGGTGSAWRRARWRCVTGWVHDEVRDDWFARRASPPPPGRGSIDLAWLLEGAARRRTATHRNDVGVMAHDTRAWQVQSVVGSSPRAPPGEPQVDLRLHGKGGGRKRRRGESAGLDLPSVRGTFMAL